MKQIESIPGGRDSICRGAGSDPSVGLARGMNAGGPSRADLRLPCWQGEAGPIWPCFSPVTLDPFVWSSRLSPLACDSL